MGREVINIRGSDVVVIVGGRSGTLGELAIAYDEGKLIGVLTGMGGIGAMAAEILAVCKKDTGARVVYEADPCRLVRKLLRLRASGPPREQPLAGKGRAKTTVEDPVCGMRILPRAAVARRTRAGTRYFFCSEECVARFDGAPANYAPKPGAPARSPHRKAQPKGGRP
jgi:YHS domain-containing protein